jgi:(1->4)-alpha-D-glucan 1-alpha-D-glucosylmutase
MDTTLDRLCRLHGVETEFTDIWGERHEVAEPSLRSLLRSMGVEADDDRAAAEALELRRRSLARPLPPVLVALEGGPLRVPVTLADDRRGARLRWTLAREDGERVEGTAHADDLPPLVRPAGEGAAHPGEEAAPRVGLELPAPPAGYHRLELLGATGEIETCRLVMAPAACHVPPGMGVGRRVWGLSAQLYALRSRRSWGIGDLGDLPALARLCRALGADVLALSPLHALFPHEPEHASPYSPSSRLFLNALFLDVESLPELEGSKAARDLVRSAAFQQRLRQLRDAAHVDYRGVAAAKGEALALIYDEFRARHLAHATVRGAAFERFRQLRGEALRRHALFEALEEHFDAAAQAEPVGWGWQSWPAAYRDPGTAEVDRFAREHEPRVTYYEWLQWLLDQQLAVADEAAVDQGLGVGLLADLAVGLERGGAETWGGQGLYALGASVGAPPDAFSLGGQNWGLPPPIPQAHAAAGYEPFAATLRSAMRHAGALRVDHVMGLMRLFWIPDGGRPADGAYVRYPLEDLLGVLALESQRNRCMVVGEDLGTVPPRVRQALKSAGVLSYRLFYFERDERGDFLPAAAHEPQALLAVTTHDLPTLTGYWRGRDLEERDALGQFTTSEQRDRQVRDRAEDRTRLLRLLEREGLLPEGMTVDPADCPEMTPALSLAVHRSLARSPARLMLVALEDVLGQLDQVNLPGTSGERPNWRLRVPADLEDLGSSARLQALAEALRAEGRPDPAPGEPTSR